MFKDVIFHKESTTAGNGNEVFVNRSRSLTVEISGTATSSKVTFYAKGLAGELRPISGININGLTLANNTTGKNEIWQFDVSGLVSVVMDLTEVSGGNISIKGRLVD